MLESESSDVYMLTPALHDGYISCGRVPALSSCAQIPSESCYNEQAVQYLMMLLLAAQMPHII